MLFVHIGMPKTGTTAFQKILANNSEELLSHNIIYPFLWRDAENIAHHDLAEKIQHSDGCDEIAQDVVSFLAENQKKDIVLSSESFSTLMSLKHFHSFYNFLHSCSKVMPVKIICALRRIDSFTESMCLHDSKIFGWEYLSGQTIANSKNVLRGYIQRRFRWTDIFFSKLCQLNLSIETCSLATIPFNDNIIRNILHEIGMDFLINKVQNFKRENSRLGFKAQCFLANFEQLSSKIISKKKIDRSNLIKLLEGKKIEFNDEIYDYNVFDYYQRRALHEFSLRISLKYNLQNYYNAFCDTEIGMCRSQNILNYEIITDNDIKKISDYVDSL